MNGYEKKFQNRVTELRNLVLCCVRAHLFFMQHSEFARYITEHQQRIFGYIYSLVGNNASAWDILQETNLVLWKKQEDFQQGTNFEAWAFTVARFQVMAFLRDRKREPLHVLTPELVEAFAEDAQVEATQLGHRLAALRHCRKRLSEKAHKLVQLYYDDELSVQQVGTHLNMNLNAVKQALFRVRRSLQDCIETTMATSK